MFVVLGFLTWWWKYTMVVFANLCKRLSA
jgi:hypothetical protein